MAKTTTANIPASIRTVYSKEIIRKAQPRLRFAQFAKKKTDLEKQSGASISFTKYDSIARGGKLTEGVNMNEKATSNSEVEIKVEEYGNAVKVTEKALQLSVRNELGEASILLANDMALVLDEALRDAALATSNQVFGNGKTTIGSMVAGDGFTTTTVKDAVEALDTSNAPKIDGQYYICIAHPHQLRQLKDDPAWINAHQYVSMGVTDIYLGEVGMYDGVRFVQTTQMIHNDATASNAKYGVAFDTYEGVIFGENSYAWAVALDVEMRDNGVEDYGRMHGIAWYAIWGFGLINEEYIYKVITA